MMLKKIAIIAPLFFFLLGLNAFADTNAKTTFPSKTTDLSVSMNKHIVVKANKVSASPAKNIAVKKQEPISPRLLPATAAYIVSIIIGGLLFIGLTFYWLFYKRRISKHSERL